MPFDQVIVIAIALSGILSVMDLTIIPSKLSHTLPHIGLSGPPSVSDQEEGSSGRTERKKELDWLNT